MASLATGAMGCLTYSTTAKHPTGKGLVIATMLEIGGAAAVASMTAKSGESSGDAFRGILLTTALVDVVLGVRNIVKDSGAPSEPASALHSSLDEAKTRATKGSGGIEEEEEDVEEASIECEPSEMEGGGAVCRFQANTRAIQVCADLTLVCGIDAVEVSHERRVCSGWLPSKKPVKKRFVAFDPPLDPAETCRYTLMGANSYASQPDSSEGSGWSPLVAQSFMRVLVLAAWDDNRIQPQEAERVAQLAGDDELQFGATDGLLDGLKSLAAARRPQLSVLRPHAKRLLQEVVALHLADGVASQEERAAYGRLAKALSSQPVPGNDQD